jgi:Heavy-metal resistance
VRRWGLVFALLLSLGVNLGILGTLAVHRLRPARPEEAPQRAAEPRPEVPQARLQRVADRLGLEGEARQRFLEQQRQFFLATSRDRLRLREVHGELRRELAAQEPDRAKVDRLVAEAGEIYVGLERAMVANVLATRGMLDAEQERLFVDFLVRLRPGRFAPPAPGEERFPPRRRRFRFRDMR